ncbi:hypothetical protein RZS08_11440, partial [Arthrospira platensis SPKY1]|nr:hypothetical protein [Arthrospira platensis SPKY1]
MEQLYHKGKQAYESGQFVRAEQLLLQSMAQPDEAVWKEQSLYLLFKARTAVNPSATALEVQRLENASTDRQAIKQAYVQWADYGLNTERDRV